MRVQLCFLTILGAVLLLLPACSNRADVKSQVSALEKTFEDPSAAAPSASEQPVTDQSRSPSSDANAYVKIALSAVRTNDFAGGVIALQNVQRMPRLTAEQHRAVFETMQAITADLQTRAVNGDPKAKAQLSAIERTRSQ